MPLCHFPCWMHIKGNVCFLRSWMSASGVKGTVRLQVPCRHTKKFVPMPRPDVFCVRTEMQKCQGIEMHDPFYFRFIEEWHLSAEQSSFMHRMDLPVHLLKMHSFVTPTILCNKCNEVWKPETIGFHYRMKHPKFRPSTEKVCVCVCVCSSLPLSLASIEEIQYVFLT